jgi:hypothetical protein
VREKSPGLKAPFLQDAFFEGLKAHASTVFACGVEAAAAPNPFGLELTPLVAAAYH